MPVSYFDLVLILIIGGFGLFGLWFGFIHTLGSLVGSVLGVYLASRYYSPVADWLIHTTGWGENFSKTIIFIIAFFIINRLVGLAFWFLDKILGFVTRLPFIHSLDKILGFVFGLLEGVIVLGISFYFISKFPFGDHLIVWMSSSVIVPHLISFASILWPFIPTAITDVQGMIPTNLDVLKNIDLKNFVSSSTLK